MAMDHEFKQFVYRWCEWAGLDDPAAYAEGRPFSVEGVDCSFATAPNLPRGAFVLHIDFGTLAPAIDERALRGLLAENFKSALEGGPFYGYSSSSTRVLCMQHWTAMDLTPEQMLEAIQGHCKRLQEWQRSSFIDAASERPPSMPAGAVLAARRALA